VKKGLDQILAVILVMLMGAMVVNVTWQVVSRYVFHNPSSFTDELARYMLIWLGLLGAAYVAGQEQHLAIDILPRQLSGSRGYGLKILLHGLVLVFAAVVMVIGGGNLVYITYILEQKSAALRLPLAWVYLVVPISGLVVILYQGIFIRRDYQKMKSVRHGMD
jgi:TRAP-type C4-dicarboxylate transport system permease small subunit